jgi:hypothetical protein
VSAGWKTHDEAKGDGRFRAVRIASAVEVCPDIYCPVLMEGVHVLSEVE